MPKTRLIVLMLSLLMAVPVMRGQGHYELSCGHLTVRLKGYGRQPLAGVRALLHQNGVTIAGELAEDSTTTVFRNVLAGQYALTARARGFAEVTDTVWVEPYRHRIKTLELSIREVELKELAVKGHAKAMVLRGDTVDYHPEAVNVLENDMARDILRQMPGVRIDGEGISVLHHEVGKTLVDGRKLFGDKPITAFDHIEATDVAKIRAYADHTDKALQAHRKRWVLDIITKSKMLSSYDGRAIAAWGSSIDKETGSDSRTRYAGGGTANFFSEDVVVSTNLMHNNQNIASTQSLRFLTTDSRPLTYSENSCAGADVTREWTKRTSGLAKWSAGYQFDKKAESRQKKLAREYLGKDLGYEWRHYDSEQKLANSSRHHQMHVDTEWRMRGGDVLTTGFKYQLRNRHTSDTQDTYDKNDRDESEGHAENLSRQQQHDMEAEAKYVATLTEQSHLDCSVDYHQSSADNDNDRRSDTYLTGQRRESLVKETRLTGQDDQWKAGGRALFSQIWGEERFLQGMSVEYVQNYAHQKMWQTAWNVLEDKEDRLNTYHYRQNTWVRQMAAVFFLKTGAVSHAVKAGWRSQTVSATDRLAAERHRFRFLMPVVTLNAGYMPPDMRTMMSLNYEWEHRTPTMLQLLPLTDTYNPYFILTGNPSLKPESQHKFFSMNSFLLNDYGQSLDVNIVFALRRNVITQSTQYFFNSAYLEDADVTVPAHGSVSTYSNRNGAYDGALTVMYSLPLDRYRSDFSATLRGGIGKTPYCMNSITDYMYRQRVDGTIGFNTSLIPKTRLNCEQSVGQDWMRAGDGSEHDRIFRYHVEATVEADLPAHCFVKAKYDFTRFHHHASGEDHCQNTLNCYLGHRFAKGRGEISLTAYDLLDAYRGRVMLTEQNYTQWNTQANDGRLVSMNVTWTFRKVKTKNGHVGNGVSW